MAYRYDMRDKTPQQQAIVRAREQSKGTFVAEGSIQKPIGEMRAVQQQLILNNDLCPRLNSTIIADQCIECVHYQGSTVKDGNNCILCDYV